jgi:hypothetical protein
MLTNIGEKVASCHLKEKNIFWRHIASDNLAAWILSAELSLLEIM